MPTKHRRKLKAARVVIYDSHTEFTMLGFEIEDLDDLKEQISMRWDRDDKCWLVHRLDTDDLIEALKSNGFVIRLRDQRD